MFDLFLMELYECLQPYRYWCNINNVEKIHYSRKYFFKIIFQLRYVYLSNIVNILMYSMNIIKEKIKKNKKKCLTDYVIQSGMFLFISAVNNNKKVACISSTYKLHIKYNICLRL